MQVGGALQPSPPLTFFRDGENTAAPSATVLGTALGAFVVRALQNKN